MTHRAPGLARLFLTLLVGVGAARPAAAAEGGLVLFPDVPILIGLLVLFTVLVIPVNQLIFRPILRVLDERADRISGTRERAERLAAQAEEILGRTERSVRELRAELEQERRSQLAGARAETADRTAGVRAEAEAELERARSEVRGALGEARRSLRAEAERLARDAAERVLGRTL